MRNANNSTLCFFRLKISLFWFVCLLCLFLPLTGFTAPRINHVKVFTVSVPDTVTQGANFDVTYTLEATHWKDAHVTEIGGLTLTDVKSYTLNKAPYQQLNVMATFYTSHVGRIKLPPMKAVIDGREVVSETKEVYVKPNPLYGEEMIVAHKWLLQKGANKDSVTLDVAQPIGNFIFFSDRRHQYFCLVAKKSTWDYAGEPVWAYSLESGFEKQSLTEIAPFFFDFYSEILTEMKDSKRDLLKNSNNMENVSPFLGELKWGQAAPYNAKLPTKDGKRVIVGCVPLSMTMIMKYYEWPKQGQGTVYFETENRKFKFDCTELKPQWEQYNNSYEENETEACTDLSKVLGTLGLMMNPKYEEAGTSANFIHIKHIMCNNLGYSGRLNLTFMPSNTETLDMLNYELRNHRPCIVSKNSHSFVCDGYEEGFYHFNFGWNGMGNGYYRIGEYLGEKEKSLFRAVITGIEPQRTNPEKEITLEKAGTLSELLSNDEQENLVSLTINGPINSSDIRLLRAMAGAKGDSFYDNRRMGNLKNLDLTSASIISDETPFRTRKAMNSYSGYKYYMHDDGTVGGRHTIYKDYKFDFNQMDEKQWKQFKSNFGKMIKKKGLAYTRLSDTEYTELSFCVKDVIGEQMFADCTSLSVLKLPQKIKSVSDYAFYNCNSLQSIIISSKAERGNNIFQDCPVLTDVSYKDIKK